MVAPNGNPYLSTSFEFNDFLGLTSVSNTNGTNATISYDVYGRPLASASPNGADSLLLLSGRLQQRAEPARHAQRPELILRSRW